MKTKKHNHPIASATTTRKYVMALGDSITYGFPYHYRVALGRMARANGSDLVFRGFYTDDLYDVGVNNNPYPSQRSAISGITADLVDTNYITSWVTQAQPDVVLMHLGTNDCRGLVNPNITMTHLISIIEKMRTVMPNVIIFAAQIIPVDPVYQIPEVLQLIIQLNALIKEQLQAMSTLESPIHIVDQFTGFDATFGVDTWDGLHPSQVSGCEKMAKKWLEAMQAQELCKNLNSSLTNIGKGKLLSTNVTNANDAFNDNILSDGWIRGVPSDIPPPPPPYLTIELGSQHNIWYFELNHYNHAFYYSTPGGWNTLDYTIQVSDNNELWTDVIMVTGNTLGQTTHGLVASVSGKYVRLVINKPNDVAGGAFLTFNVREFIIMGKPV
jgi:lysophospholipase L1-like esterase